MFFITSQSYRTNLERIWKNTEKQKKSQISRVGRNRILKNGCRIEARACLDPLFGFYFAVAVEVGAEVAVPAKAAAGIVAQQQHDEHPQGMFLKIGTGIGGMPPFVGPAFIADADRMGIVVLTCAPGCPMGRSVFISPFLRI